MTSTVGSKVFVGANVGNWVGLSVGELDGFFDVVGATDVEGVDDGIVDNEGRWDGAADGASADWTAAQLEIKSSATSHVGRDITKWRCRSITENNLGIGI